MDELTLLADLHKAGLRQGPGSPDVTRRAMVLAGLDGSRPLEIADIGCGIVSLLPIDAISGSVRRPKGWGSGS